MRTDGSNARRIHLIFWELGDGTRVRTKWKRYRDGCKAIIENIEETSTVTGLEILDCRAFDGDARIEVDPLGFGRRMIIVQEGQVDRGRSWGQVQIEGREVDRGQGRHDDGCQDEMAVDPDHEQRVVGKACPEIEGEVRRALRVCEVECGAGIKACIVSNICYEASSIHGKCRVY